MTHLARIASEARPPGSPNPARTRDYQLEQLRALGHTPSVQMATTFSRGFGAPTAATVRNVLARIPGEQPGSPAVLVTAHYDSHEIALGAADDGSGVVAILEAVRALGSRPPLQNDLIVLITDAEEIGLLGARAFVDEHPWFDDVAVFMGIEMRGGGGPSLMFETGADNGWVIEALRRADPYPAANSVSYEIYRRMPNDTDFTPFKEAGKQGLNFAAVGKPHVYHQYYDSPENLSEGTLQHHGEHVLAMVEYLGNADLTDVDAPDVSYIAVPFVGLVTYGPLWIRILGAAAAAAWLAGCFVGLKGGARWSGLLVGLG
ncbi:MAG: M20/M25/M40 family metallo-hydrolase, partial [Gemmatimonadetes bacterium]|nr:M20/M25/M40 family metallo-hydrolase [Gemmatimonadota bacterium]